MTVPQARALLALRAIDQAATRCDAAALAAAARLALEHCAEGLSPPPFMTAGEFAAHAAAALQLAEAFADDAVAHFIPADAFPADPRDFEEWELN